VLSVFDIPRVARPMTEAGSFSLSALPDAPRGQFAAWHVPPSCTRIEQAYLAPMGSPNGTGGIRLVKFHGAPQRVMRSSQRSWDTGGLFDVDVFSPDVDSVYRKLQSFGWSAMGEPVDYTEAHLVVRQVVAKGPDGLIVAIIQRYSPPADNLVPGAAMSRIGGGVHMVKDYDRSRQFLIETLGWRARLEFTIENAAEPGADVLGLPLPFALSARRRIGMFGPPGPGAGGIELIANLDMHGRDFAAHCVAPNVGLLAQRFPVADAERYAAAIVARGGAIYAQPSRYEIAPLGAVTAFCVRTPDGAILEFYSRA
jgi:catechol 2,3-dioxygenase-like lactoylglutathione lyase family enzyme